MSVASAKAKHDSQIDCIRVATQVSVLVVCSDEDLAARYYGRRVCERPKRYFPQNVLFRFDVKVCWHDLALLGHFGPILGPKIGEPCRKD